MNTKLSKILTIVVALISVIGIILYIRVVMASDDNAVLDGRVSGFVTFSKLILILTAILAIGFSILNLIKHPQALKKSLISIVILGAILAVTYFTATSDVVTDFSGNVLEASRNQSTSKWVSALINFTGILGAAGLLLIGYGVVRGYSK